MLTAPGASCPTHVVGVNEGNGDPEADVGVSYAASTPNDMASARKVWDESFGVEYGRMCP